MHSSYIWIARPLLSQEQARRNARRAALVCTQRRSEREVLSLMAEGRSNAAIAEALSVSLAGVEKHTQRIFAKLGLMPDDDGAHRRVAAVLRFLR